MKEENYNKSDYIELEKILGNFLGRVLFFTENDKIYEAIKELMKIGTLVSNLANEGNRCAKIIEIIDEKTAEELRINDNIKFK